MSLQTARGKTTKSDTRRDARKAMPTQVEQDRRAVKVAKIAATIVKALELEHNQGYIDAYGEENLLLKLAYEIKFGDHMGSAKQHEKARQDFFKGNLDAQIKSSDVQRQIDARQLLFDAVEYALEKQMIHRLPPSSDDMVALHLPLAQINPHRVITRADLPQPTQESESPKWVVFLREAERPIPDHAYLPMKHGTNDSGVSTDPSSDDISYAPRTGRQAHQLRLWGELAA